MLVSDYWIAILTIYGVLYFHKYEERMINKYEKFYAVTSISFFSVFILIRVLHFCITWSQKFLSFYKEIIVAQHFLYYIILLNYV